jgi:hypothetical protein
MNNRRRSLGLPLAAFALSVVLLEVVISTATTGPGQSGAGNLGPQPPFGRVAQANTGEIVVTAKIARLCLGNSSQSGTPAVLNTTFPTRNPTISGALVPLRITLPLRNLSILIAEAPPGKGQEVVATNSSGIAQTKVPAGVYSVTVGDLKVNRSLTLSVGAASEAILNLTSEENWTESSFIAYTSAAVSGQPLPWTNVTAVFPRIANASSGGPAALILGSQPSCSAVLARPAGSYETTVGLLTVGRGPGGVWVTFAAPSSAKSGFHNLTLVTYTSKYVVQSKNA